MVESELTYWHWWLLATMFIVVEILSPMVFFLWMGAAAGVVGVVLLILPGMDWRYQILLFSFSSIASIASWRWHLRKNPIRTDRPTLNRRGDQYTGRVFTLTEPVVDGRGRIKVGDSVWTIAGEDCPANTKIRVTGVDGNVLQVARIDS